MTIAALVIAVLALVLAAASPTLHRPRLTTTWIEERTHRRVLIHTTDESSFEGILVAVDADALVLADAKSLDGEVPIELAGEQWFDRDRIKFLQVVAP
ncbi:MAG: LSm family protein [Actinomycetota bacterium]